MTRIQTYGCVKCQRWHNDRDDPLYREHLYFQSKHGIRTISEREWASSKLVMASREPGEEG